MNEVHESPFVSVDSLMQLMFGRWPADMIAVAAELGISDELAAGPASPDELAARTGTHSGTLHGLLRALAGVGVYAPTATGQFELTPQGELLRSDVPGSLRQLAIMLGQDWRRGRLGRAARRRPQR